MGSASLTNLVASIVDGTPGTLIIETAERDEIRLECIYRGTETPKCFAVATAEPFSRKCDAKSSWTLQIVNELKEPIILNTTFVKQLDPNTVVLKGANATNPASLREYFRINLETGITLDYTMLRSKTYKRAKLQGKTLDISGSGVLAIFPEKPYECREVKIDLQLTQPEKIVSCMGHLVRLTALSNGQWQAALHFINVANKDREDIIANCFSEQRRRLRENIQTNDS